MYLLFTLSNSLVFASICTIISKENIGHRDPAIPCEPIERNTAAAPRTWRDDPVPEATTPGSTPPPHHGHARDERNTGEILPVQ
mmetsp:Transcript_945/g.2039  ORF Transcript_945/g.2039 Transcript_945/m.2039 type:complete len:84 (+) Transcript_945:42-293(+)|eukprot:444333-Prymnesium_polylepis.1